MGFGCFSLLDWSTSSSGTLDLKEDEELRMKSSKHFTATYEEPSTTAVAILDIIVQIHNFRNIDLYARGLYYVRINLNSSIGNQAIPYKFYSNGTNASTVRGQKISLPSGGEYLKPASILADERSFQSRVFAIRYRDESVALAERAQFRLALPISEERLLNDDKGGRDTAASININVELLVADFKSRESKSTKVLELVETIPADPVFVPAAKQTIAASLNAVYGVNEYYPITFDDTHFCEMGLTIHASIVCLRSSKGNYQKLEDKASKSFHLLGNSTNFAYGSSFEDMLLMITDKNGKNKILYDDFLRYEKFRRFLIKVLEQSKEGATQLFSWLWDECLTAEARESAHKCLEMGEGNAVQVTEKDNLACYCSDDVVCLRPVLSTPSLSEMVNVTICHGPKHGRQVTLTSLDFEINDRAKHIFIIWSQIVALLPFAASKSSEILRSNYIKGVKIWWSRRSQVQLHKACRILCEKSPASLASTSEKLRTMLSRNKIEQWSTLPTYDCELYKEQENLPICLIHIYKSEEQVGPVAPVVETFDEGKGHNMENQFHSLCSTEMKQMISVQPGVDTSYSRRQPDLNYGKHDAVHLFVLHHGYNGTAFDMRLLRSYLLLFFGPQVHVLNSSVNEEDCDTTFAIMGARLATDIRKFIMNKCPQLADPADCSRISCIGHSVGSIVIRVALASPLLAVYRPKMHTFLSLFSPHLGTTYVPSVLVSTGLWAMRRFQHVHIMDELHLQDAQTPEECFMYKLSNRGGFADFKHVILVSGHQDQYVPLHSALSCIPSMCEKDEIVGPTIISMAANLISTIDPSRIIRVTLDQVFPKLTFDTIIGRAAHVAILDSPAVVHLLLLSLFQYLS